MPPLAAADQQQPAQPPSQSADPSSSNYEFTYRGSDGRVKATFEQAFKNRVGASGDISSSSSGGSSQERAPWALSYQMSERYSLLWNDDLKARLLKVRGSGQPAAADASAAVARRAAALRQQAAAHVAALLSTKDCLPVLSTWSSHARRRCSLS